MSQSTIFSGASAVLEPEPEQAASGRSKLLVLAGGAVVALAGVGALLLTGGSQDVALGPPPVAPAPAAAQPSATPTAPPEAAVAAAPARDPFAALYVPPAVGGAGSTPAGAGAGPAPAVPADTVPAAPAPTAPAAEPVGPPVGVPGTGTPEISTGRTLVLARVEGPANARRAVFSLDGAPVSAGVGDSFGADLLLLSVQQGPEAGQWTAVVQAGSGEPFDVVTGRPATVT